MICDLLRKQSSSWVLAGSQPYLGWREIPITLKSPRQGLMSANCLRQRKRVIAKVANLFKKLTSKTATTSIEVSLNYSC